WKQPATAAAYRSLFVFLGHAFGLMMRNALVTIDAGHDVLARHLMLLARALLLHLGIHAIQAVAVAAFTRVGCLHPCPFATCQLQTFGLELFPRSDGTGKLAPHFA